MRGLLRNLRETLDPPVLLGAAGIISVFVGYGALIPVHAATSFRAVRGFIIRYFGWSHIPAASGIPLFVLWLALRRMGGISDWAGHAVGVMATVGALFGVGTSLGFSAMQINGALERIAAVPMDLASSWRPSRRSRGSSPSSSRRRTRDRW